MNPDDGKIWEAIDKLRESQRETNAVLEGIKVILGERCRYREQTVNRAFEVQSEVSRQHGQRLNKLEVDMSLLGLTKARLVGFGMGLAAGSSVLTAVIMKIVFSGL